MPRGRPKKQTEELSSEQTWNVLEFARQLYNFMPGVFSPDLVNSHLKNINMNPLKATADEIDTALLDPKNHELQLRGYSGYFQYTNMLYKRMLGYLANMLSFDYTYTCMNVKKEDDYTSDGYLKDEKILVDFMDKFDVKKEFKKVMRQLISQDAFYCALREDGEQFTLQELPIDYCKITGKFEYGFLFDVNMQLFFGQSGVDINMYPDCFKQYYKRIMDNKDNGYKPSKAIDKRTGEWNYWVQTSPEDNLWCWKFNQEQVGQVPFLAPLFPDLILTPTIRTLQKNKYIIEANKVMIGLIPLLKDTKSGNVKDMLALDPATAGKFANLIKKALPDAINFGVAPFEKIETYDFKGSDNNLLESHNKNTVATSGNTSRLLYSSDKQNAEETRNSIGVDEYLMTFIYPFFADFLNYHINRKTRKYKFKIVFEGTEFPANKQARLDNALTLLDKGIILPMKISAAMGMQPHEFERQLAMARANKWTEKLTPIVTAYTNNGENGGGRPRSKNPSDSAIQTQDDGGNISKGGSI